jgi:hypothetical protein
MSIAQLKKRNGNKRAAYHATRGWVETYKLSQTHISKLIRTDAETGIVEEISRRKFESEFLFDRSFEKVAHLAPYTGKSSIIWDELKCGAKFYTEKAMFHIEKIEVEKKEERTETDGAAMAEENPVPERLQIEEPEKGFVTVSRSKVLAARDRVKNQDYSCEVRKIETGVFEVDSHAGGENYTIELNRGIFGVTAHCDCPDFTFTRLEKDQICKHIAAVYFFERQERYIELNSAA